MELYLSKHSLLRMRINRKQTAALAEMVGHRQAWVGRVVQRLEKLGYVPDDPLLAAAMNAQDALARLRMSAHYSAMDGAGRKSAEQSHIAGS